MKLNLRGVTRLVFEFKNVVVKIPNFSYSWNNFLLGLISNIRESQAYSTAKILGNDHLLCPVIWSSWGGWIVVMRKVKVCNWMDELDYSPWIKAGYGGDDKPQNYGYLKDKLVKIDYE